MKDPYSLVQAFFESKSYKAHSDNQQSKSKLSVAIIESIGTLIKVMSKRR